MQRRYKTQLVIRPATSRRCPALLPATAPPEARTPISVQRLGYKGIRLKRDERNLG